MRLHQKLFRQWKVDFFHFEKVELGFNQNGPYAAYLGALNSRNHDSFLHKATCTVKNLADGSEFDLRWIFTRLRNITNTGETMSASISLGKYLKKDSPENLDIMFTNIDYDGELKSTLVACKNSWLLYIIDKSRKGVDVRTVKAPSQESFSKTEIYLELINSIRSYFFWKIGNYEILYRFFFDKSKNSVNKKICFFLSAGDVKKLESNILLMVDALLMERQYNAVAAFAAILHSNDG